jgi:hypothetical protein
VRSRVYKVAIETYIYYHTQSGGYQVRKVKTKNGKRVADVSKYFGTTRYGNLRGAATAAREWKNRHLRRW